MAKSLRPSRLAGHEVVLACAAVEMHRQRLVEDVIAAAAYKSLRSIEAPRSDAAFKAGFDALRSDWHAEAIGIGEQLALALKPDHRGSRLRWDLTKTPQHHQH